MNLPLIKEVGIKQYLFRKLVRQFFKRILKKGLWVRLPNGARMFLPAENRFGTEVFITQANVDWGSEALLRELSARDRAFIDVGSHIGYYSLLMQDSVRQVHAFEPDDRSRQTLERNCAPFKNIAIHAQAVGNYKGTSEFILTESQATSHLAVAGSEADSGRKISVETVTLDSFCSEKAITCGSIKIDAEGADKIVLEGAREVIMRDRPLILAEIQYEPELDKFLLENTYQAWGILRHTDTRKKYYGRISAPLPRHLSSK
jgi:FkbM family methyltransferase